MRIIPSCFDWGASGTCRFSIRVVLMTMLIASAWETAWAHGGVVPRNTIAIAFQGCLDASSAAGFLVGDGVLDCNGDPAVDESVAIAAGSATFRNLTTGETISVPLGAGGVASSGPVNDGTFVVTFTIDGAERAFSSACSGVDASGMRLGLLGGIDSPERSLYVAGQVDVTCKALVALGAAESGTAGTKAETAAVRDDEGHLIRRGCGLPKDRPYRYAIRQADAEARCLRWARW